MYKDQMTGDTLTTGEYISWKIQSIIRNWTFLIIITVVTIVVWSTNNSVALIWWNLAASYLALVIESIVGISMYSQTKRDAVILRELRVTSQHIEKLSEVLLKDIESVEEHFEEEKHD